MCCALGVCRAVPHIPRYIGPVLNKARCISEFAAGGEVCMGQCAFEVLCSSKVLLKDYVVRIKGEECLVDGAVERIISVTPQQLDRRFDGKQPEPSPSHPNSPAVRSLRQTLLVRDMQHTVVSAQLKTLREQHEVVARTPCTTLRLCRGALRPSLMSSTPCTTLRLCNSKIVPQCGGRGGTGEREILPLRKGAESPPGGIFMRCR